MGVSIQHKEEQAVDEAAITKVSVIDVELIEKVDEYGSASEKLAKAMKKLEPLTAKVAKLKKELAEEANTYPADESVTLEGTSWTVEYGKNAMKVLSTNKEVLRETLGPDVYFELSSVSIGDIRLYCTPPQIASILTEDREGGRTGKLKKK